MCAECQVIAKFLALMYSYLNISMSNNIIPDEIKGREIHHSFPITLFQVQKWNVLSWTKQLSLGSIGFRFPFYWGFRTSYHRFLLDLFYSFFHIP